MTILPKSVMLGAAKRVANRIDGVFHSLRELRNEASPILNAPDVHHADLAKLQPVAHAMIDQHAGLVSGAGLAVAPGSLADAAAWMQSWHRSGTTLSLTRHSLNPSAVNYYDYTDMEWYREPATRGEPYLTDPYIDLGGTERMIVTAAIPAEGWNNTVSVIAADLSLPCLERTLLDALGSREEQIALVGARGKIIATNSAQLAIAGRIPPQAAAEGIWLPTTEIIAGWRLTAVY